MLRHHLGALADQPAVDLPQQLRLRRLAPETVMHAHHRELHHVRRRALNGHIERDALAEELDNALSAFLVALDENDRVVGYAGLQVVLDEGYITNVAVRPDCRRRGVAGKLLDVFERFAKGNHLAFLSLEVRASNYAAIALYGQHGYRGVGRRRNYYEHPKEDAVIMTREFGEAAK